MSHIRYFRVVVGFESRELIPVTLVPHPGLEGSVDDYYWQNRGNAELPVTVKFEDGSTAKVYISSIAFKLSDVAPTVQEHNRIVRL